MIYINETLVGPNQLMDRFLLESAVERPQATFDGVDLYPDIHSKAAALIQSLIVNHPFVDGNKRTGLVSDITFYAFNGYEFDAPLGQVVDFVVDIATGELGEVEAIAGYLADWTYPLEPPV